MVGVKFSREITRRLKLYKILGGRNKFDNQFYRNYWFLYILRNGITIKYFIFLLKRQLFYLENNR